MIRFMAVAALGLFIAAFPEQSYACPNPNINGTIVRASGESLYDSIQLDVTAGGDNQIVPCKIPFRTDNGDGYVTTSPDFTMDITQLGNYELEFRVVSECDSVLVLNTGTWSWYYDDDDNGNLDARIYLTRPQSGVFDLWVGTYNGAACPAYLEVETYYR